MNSSFDNLFIPCSVAYYQENDELRFNGESRICMDGQRGWMDGYFIKFRSFQLEFKPIV